MMGYIHIKHVKLAFLCTVPVEMYENVCDLFLCCIIGAGCTGVWLPFNVLEFAQLSGEAMTGQLWRCVKRPTEYGEVGT